MAGDARDEKDAGSRPGDGAALSARLKRLGDRLDEVAAGQRSDANQQRPSTDMSGLAMGFRLASEFVAGVAAGGLLGWALDRWVGTSPWGLIVFVLLGFAASVLNMIRAARAAAGQSSGGTTGRN
jgi:ATP synthase protein I